MKPQHGLSDTMICTCLIRKGNDFGMFSFGTFEVWDLNAWVEEKGPCVFHKIAMQVRVRLGHGRILLNFSKPSVLPSASCLFKANLAGMGRKERGHIMYETPYPQARLRHGIYEINDH